MYKNMKRGQCQKEDEKKLAVLERKLLRRAKAKRSNETVRNKTEQWN